MNRVIIYPKDICLITGRSEQYARAVLKKIRKHLAKEEHQFVTIEEYCKYYGLSVESVERYLR